MMRSIILTCLVLVFGTASPMVAGEKPDGSSSSFSVPKTAEKLNWQEGPLDRAECYFKWAKERDPKIKMKEYSVRDDIKNYHIEITRERSYAENYRVNLSDGSLLTLGSIREVETQKWISSDGLEDSSTSESASLYYKDWSFFLVSSQTGKTEWVSGVPELPITKEGQFETDLGFFNSLFSFDVEPGIQVVGFFYGISHAGKYECDENVFSIMYLVFRNGEFHGLSGPFVIGGSSAFLSGNPLESEVDPDGYVYEPESHWPDFDSASYDPVLSPAWVVVPRVLLPSVGEGRAPEVVIWRRYYESKTWREETNGGGSFRFVKQEVLIQRFDEKKMSFGKPELSADIGIPNEKLWIQAIGPTTCEERFNLIDIPVVPLYPAKNPSADFQGRKTTNDGPDSAK